MGEGICSFPTLASVTNTTGKKVKMINKTSQSCLRICLKTVELLIDIWTQICTKRLSFLTGTSGTVGTITDISSIALSYPMAPITEGQNKLYL